MSLINFAEGTIIHGSNILINLSYLSILSSTKLLANGMETDLTGLGRQILLNSFAIAVLVIFDSELKLLIPKDLIFSILINNHFGNYSNNLCCN